MDWVVQRWNDYQNWGANIKVLTDIVSSTSIYARIRRTSTTYSFDMSDDGISWIQLASTTLTFTPSEFGIFMDNKATGYDVGAAFPFFRYTDSDVGLDSSANGRRIALWDKDSTVAGITGSTYSFFDINKPKATADTPDDEFNTTTLDAKWTEVAGSSGTVDFFESANVSKYDLATRSDDLLMQVGQQTGQQVLLRQDYTLPDGASIILALSPTLTHDADGGGGIASNEIRCGLALNDSDSDFDAGSNALRILFDTQGSGWRVIHQTGTSTTIAGMPTNAAVDLEKMYLRIARDGSAYHAFYSMDGENWNPMTSTTPGSAPDNIWIYTECLNTFADPVPIQVFHWLRQGTNALDPWDTEVTVGGSGEGSTYTSFDINRPKVTADTPDDEFSELTLDAKWTAVSGSSGTVDLFESSNVSEYDLITRPGNLLVQVGQTGAQEVMLRQDYTLPDNKSIITAISPNLMSDDLGGTDSGILNNELQIGLSINDSDTDHDAGNSHEVFFDANVNGWRLIQQIHNGGSVVGGTTPGNAMPDLQKIYLRISRVSSAYYGFFSMDGTTWFPLSGDTPAGTYDNVWIWVRSGATFGDPIPIQAFDWVRLGTNSIDPWDTTVIKYY
jgi:hypothetical protein